MVVPRDRQWEGQLPGQGCGSHCCASHGKANHVPPPCFWGENSSDAGSVAVCQVPQALLSVQETDCTQLSMVAATRGGDDAQDAPP